MLVQKRLILYELNEVPFRVMRHFAGLRPESAVARLLRRGRCYETVAEDHGHLSPWITWPTLHRGAANTRHGICDFGQNLAEIDRELPPAWQILARAGLKVGVFGSLHSYPPPADLSGYAFYVPDTFAAGPECFPADLSAFQELNLGTVALSGRNVSRRLPVGAALRFLAAAPGLGLRGRTALGLAGQLAAEAVNKARTVRRRSAQAEIAFDLFLAQLAATRPDYCSFFTNHVASSMHRYWPATFPEDYGRSAFAEEWRRTYRDEIGHAMRVADRQLRALMRFVERDRRYSLLVVGSMGQAAVDGQEMVRTQLNIGDHAAFMAALGLAREDWRARLNMVPLYTYEIRPGAEQLFRDAVAQLRVNGRPLEVAAHGSGVYRVALGQVNLDEERIEILLGDRRCALAEVGLVNMRIEDEAGSNAYHVPDGMMIVYDPAAPGDGRIRGPLGTTEILPTVLRNFGLAPPPHMRPPQPV